ncbi:tetratricopeptide repeat protein [Pseudanabaena sp. PCC 6802]|uniref:tetratricopeptide repeat protein n=1 Tax=Pseudanabaena sp. PCC 6802 TaxID=118173 RepID=UPI00034756A6|nr:tetratricopeptide repeat protein [Pseudanabaena sp. PCC 6802]
MARSPRGFGKTSTVVSLCAIVKNESHRIADCLDSVRGFVDEAIVVDTGSTDDTVMIAKQRGARVFQFDWCDDFATARNYSLQQASGDWILVLDADEKLEPSAKIKLKQLVKQRDCLSANLLRQEIEAKQSPYSLVSRFFRRRADIYFSGYYHESIDDSISKIRQQSPHWQVYEVSGVSIQHYGYQSSEIDMKGKQNLAKRLMQKHLAEFPSDAYMHSKLGALYVESGEPSRGLDLIQQGIAILNQSSDANPHVQFELFYHAAIARSHQGEWQIAENCYQQALVLDVPDLVKLPALNNLGNLWQAQGKYEQAIAAYQRVTQIAPDFAKGFYNLGIALKSSGQLRSATSAYRQAIALDPEYADAHQNLGVTLLKLGQMQEAIAAFVQAIALHERQNNSNRAQIIRDGMRDLGLKY